MELNLKIYFRILTIMFALFAQIILTTIRFDHTMLIFFKLIEIAIKIMNAGASCRVFKLFLEVAVARKKISNFLHNSNFKISFVQTLEERRKYFKNREYLALRLALWS